MHSRDQRRFKQSDPRHKQASTRNLEFRYEECLALARGAASANDPIAMENWHQHAEHFFRTLKERST